MLKIFIILLCNFLLLCECFTTEQLQTDLNYIKTCNKTSPIPLRTLNDFLIDRKLNEKQSGSFKCFLHCLFVKYGWMDEDGGFLLHNIKLTVEQTDTDLDDWDFVLYECTAITSTDRCERSLLFTRCFWNKMEEEQRNRDQLIYNFESK
ncbi:uncharacterized protein LOC109597794 [Aethina tumida]|uniref:uncharacterized protein LOC109597794 n=1 Tax=Aethina tumida TaxID=116153 RepID=UPI00096ADC1B|nr:uncharacterized protein LOC109597794 [Aethina tumida]